jgi:curved DNA-binding protein CbpA
LPIGPQEAFVISRIDGIATARDIGYATGFDESFIEECLRNLEQLGAVSFLDANSTSTSTGRLRAPATIPTNIAIRSSVSPKPPSAPNEIPSDAASRTPSQSLLAPSHTVVPNAPAASSNPASSSCDLDFDRQQAILSLFSQLETLDHYRLLGVSESADKKVIKAAYYDKVKIFHPDRYFGKNLGSFRSKLEQCFARITDAHEILTSPESRAEYDLYLSSQRQSEALEQALNASITPEDLDRLEQRLARAVAPSSGHASSSPNASVEIPRSDPFVTFSAVPASDAAPSSRQLTDEDRKRALARKLRLSQPNLRVPSQSSMKSVSVPPRDQMAEQLRRQLEHGRRVAGTGQLAALLSDADAAVASGDPIRAAKALRTAQSLAPGDPNIGRKLAEAQALAAATLADTYVKQGEYEEKGGRWDAAARSYERAAYSKPLASTWEAAARCLLEGGGDLRAASEHMRKAMVLEPGRAASHLLLGRIFMAARMPSSALAELDRARSLDPNNDTVVALLKRLERESH